MRLAEGYFCRDCSVQIVANWWKEIVEENEDHHSNDGRLFFLRLINWIEDEADDKNSFSKRPLFSSLLVDKNTFSLRFWHIVSARPFRCQHEKKRTAVSYSSVVNVYHPWAAFYLTTSADTTMRIGYANGRAQSLEFLPLRQVPDPCPILRHPNQTSYQSAFRRSFTTKHWLKNRNALLSSRSEVWMQRRKCGWMSSV